MTLWWIGNAILLIVILPVVLLLLRGVLTPIGRIRVATTNILSNAGTLIGQLEPVPGQLAKTDEIVRQVAVGATRYAGSVQKLLDAS